MKEGKERADLVHRIAPPDPADGRKVILRQSSSAAVNYPPLQHVNHHHHNQ